MPILLQICAVIVTIGFVAIAVVTVRAMMRFEKVAAEFEETAKSVRESLDQVQNVTHEITELVSSVSAIVPKLQGVVNRFEDLGQRTASLSSDVLEQIEAPVRTAVAVARGMRRGTSHLFDRLMEKFTNRRSQMNGGTDHERQFQRR